VSKLCYRIGLINSRTSTTSKLIHKARTLRNYQMWGY
jgi:hypothetical protein